MNAIFCNTALFWYWFKASLSGIFSGTSNLHPSQHVKYICCLPFQINLSKYTMFSQINLWYVSYSKLSYCCVLLYQTWHEETQLDIPVAITLGVDVFLQYAKLILGNFLDLWSSELLNTGLSSMEGTISDLKELDINNIQIRV